MKLINENPFRIAGILANASAREIQSRKGKITAFARVGKPIISDFDFDFLSPISRENGTIEKSFLDIEQNQDKVNHALFWFMNANKLDETAIGYLKNGDKEKATEIWEKITDGKEVNSKNFSAFNNIGTLYFLNNSEQKTKKGIEAKIKLLESDYFKDFAHSVADETLTIDADKQIEVFVEALLKQFKNQFSTTETLDLFNNCNGTAQKYLSKRFTEEPIHKIETQIEQTKKKRVQNKLNAFRFGKDLYQNTKSELDLLKNLLGSTNAQYKLLADNIAKEILQCSIDYFNESQKEESNTDYLAEAMELAKLADSVAVSSITKGRIKENIATLEGMKDSELNQAIAVLQSVKDAFERNEAEIMEQVERQERTMAYGQSINWSKVNELIDNSINWDKVVELIQKAIPKQNINKIKNVNNQTALSEYKSLANFVLSKLSFSQVNKVKYICYWKTESVMSNAGLTVKSLPLWAKWCLGIATFLLIVGLIWGEEGFEVVFSIAGVIGIFAFIGWLQNFSR